MKKVFLLLFIASGSSFMVLRAQTRKIDSLRHAVKNANSNDTNRVNALNGLAFALYNVKPDSTIVFAEAANALSVKLGFKKGEALSLNVQGIANSIKGENEKSLDFYKRALKLYTDLGDKSRMAGVLSNIGLRYGYDGDYTQALDYDLQSLKLDEEIGNKKGEGILLNNMGLLYNDQKNYEKALDYGQRSLKIGKEIGNKYIQSIAFSLVGSVYYNMVKYPEALNYCTQGLRIDSEMGDVRGLAITKGNIGNIYYARGVIAQSKNDKAGCDSLYRKALAYDLDAAKMEAGVGDKTGEGNLLGNIGTIYLKTGQYKIAEDYIKKAIILDSISDSKDYLAAAEQYLSSLYDTIHDYKPALIWYTKAMILKDTMFNEEKNKALTRKELTYEFDRKQAAEKAEQDIKDARQRIVIWSVLGGLMLAVMFAGFIFRSLRLTRKQKRIIEIKNVETERQKTFIEEQKTIVEEKNKDILASISYAKRLQDAILPPLSEVKKVLQESFLIYKPKDIVAGDFYWLEKTGDSILIAAADCTGHGVPGALVSVVCSNALNRTVKEFKITEPGKILDKVRELVVETFEKSEDIVQDGMDISLAAITASLPSKGGVKENSSDKNTNLAHSSPLGSGGAVSVQWAGANNLLWYIKNGEMIELTATKEPVGKYYNTTPFTTHTLNLQKGDILYLFTDGYPDQFGGPKGKKYKYRKFQEKLLAISHKPLTEQKLELEREFDEWKGNLEQVDDVLVIGIRV